VAFLLLSVATLTLAAAGVFSGRRVKWAVVALGLLLVTDLSRANLPWIRYWDWKFKYASNPIIDQLRQKSFEQRVTAELMPMSRAWLIDNSPDGAWFARLYFEWLQHPFQFYAVRSLDINQMPWVSETDTAFLKALRPPNETNLFRCGRLWELTNTRYVVGMASFLDFLNKRVDPDHERFRVHTAFSLAPKPGINEVTREEQLTAVPDPKGPFALFEFAGALPRTKLFSFNQWIVNTNDESALATLADRGFNPSEKLVVSDEIPVPALQAETNSNGGSVEIVLPPSQRRPDPRLVTLKADVSLPSILLLNDHYHPDWKVFVDGKPERVLRCNFVMRGVYLDAGKHIVEFRLQPPNSTYISFGSLVVALALCLYAGISSRRPTTPAPAATAATQTSPARPRKGK